MRARIHTGCRRSKSASAEFTLVDVAPSFPFVLETTVPVGAALAMGDIPLFPRLVTPGKAKIA
jgi:hypothetical protein